MTASRTQRVLVMIPTYNEAVGIRSTMDDILATGPGLEILIIDDSSPDGTARLVTEHPSFNQRIHLLSRPGKLGLGTAYREGYRWGSSRSYDCFVQIDADYSHDPKDIPKLLAAIDTGVDVAIASRYVDGVRVLNWPLRRMMLSIFAGFYVRTITCMPFTDPTSGFKAIHRSAVEKLDWRRFTTGGYSFQIELHFYLWRAGVTCREIPIIFTERRAGESKMSREIAWEATTRVVSLGLERLYRK